MTADEVIDGLMHRRFRRSFVIPRYTPSSWWECDVYELTDAGFAVEYEVKTSLTDFRADATKDRRIFDLERNQEIFERKHDLLAAGDPRGPSRFWFVATEGLLSSEDVPRWAGLIGIKDHWSTPEVMLKAAPQLHRWKVSHMERMQAEGTAYWRMHSAFYELSRLRRERKRIAR